MEGSDSILFTTDKNAGTPADCDPVLSGSIMLPDTFSQKKVGGSSGTSEGCKVSAIPGFAALEGQSKKLLEWREQIRDLLKNYRENIDYSVITILKQLHAGISTQRSTLELEKCLLKKYDGDERARIAENKRRFDQRRAREEGVAQARLKAAQAAVEARVKAAEAAEAKVFAAQAALEEQLLKFEGSLRESRNPKAAPEKSLNLCRPLRELADLDKGLKLNRELKRNELREKQLNDGQLVLNHQVMDINNKKQLLQTQALDLKIREESLSRAEQTLMELQKEANQIADHLQVLVTAFNSRTPSSMQTASRVHHEIGSDALHPSTEAVRELDDGQPIETEPTQQMNTTGTGQSTLSQPRMLPNIKYNRNRPGPMFQYPDCPPPYMQMRSGSVPVSNHQMRPSTQSMLDGPVPHHFSAEV